MRHSLTYSHWNILGRDCRKAESVDGAFVTGPMISDNRGMQPEDRRHKDKR